MKPIYKRTLLLILILSLASNSITVFAGPKKTSASYDLEKGGTQTFFILNENGDYDEIIVEEISGNARIDNGTYKITHKALAWTAGFYITISSNKIIKAYSPYYTVSLGNISSDYLTLNNTTTATYSFLYTSLGINFSTGVVASIENNNLIISKK